MIDKLVEMLVDQQSSINFTKCDYFLCGFIKLKLFFPPPPTAKTMKIRICI